MAIELVVSRNAPGPTANTIVRKSVSLIVHMCRRRYLQAESLSNERVERITNVYAGKHQSRTINAGKARVGIALLVSALRRQGFHFKGPPPARYLPLFLVK